MSEKLYGNPKQMSLFEDMEQSLLEAIEMEYGKDYREKVEKELKIEPFNNKYLCQYTDDLVIPSEVSKTLWEFGKDPKKFIHTGINEIDTYISEINSQDNFIAEVNSLPMPESYPHEDDNFYIPEEYKNMTIEELKIEKEKLLKELLKGRKQMNTKEK